MQLNMSAVASTARIAAFVQAASTRSNVDEDARTMSPPQFISTASWVSSVKEEGPDERWYPRSPRYNRDEERGTGTEQIYSAFVEPRRTELSSK
jgi:hypothetical protein